MKIQYILAVFIAVFIVYTPMDSQAAVAKKKKVTKSKKLKKAKKRPVRKTRVRKKKVTVKPKKPEKIALPLLRSAELKDLFRIIEAKGKFKDILQPVVNRKYTLQEIELCKRILAHLSKKQFSKARLLQKDITDPVMIKFLDWYKIKSNPSLYTLSELRTYRIEHPDWPNLKSLKIASEAKLLSASLEQKKGYFDESDPISTTGLFAKATLLRHENKTEEAKKIIRDLWRNKRLPISIIKLIASKHKDLLNDDDHYFRIQKLLYRNSRATTSLAKGALKYLSPKRRKEVAAEIALLRNTKANRKKIAQKLKEKKLTPLLMYREIRSLRKRKKYTKAWEILALAPNTPEKLVDPKRWWKQKRTLIIEALDKKKYELAYNFAKNHGQNTVNEMNDAEFLAGWIAHSFLKDSKKAYPHFVNLNKSADGPRSLSRSHYWMGMTAKAQGYIVKSKQHFNDGAKYFNTFYGQLSKQSLKPEEYHIKIPATPAPTKADIEHFQKHDAVNAIVLAYKLRKDYIAARFILHLRYQLTKPGQMILLADLAKQIDLHQQSVRVGKTAMFRDYKAAEYAYPINLIPEYNPLVKPPETAFSYAIARQESEFNSKIKSHAGARGLMQVMPATAKYLSRKYKITYSKDGLTDNPSYNVQLGNAYITEGLAGFSGSYIKTIAGFNAGPGNVIKWVKKNGDPSKPDVDPVDWIERIPFKETRHYVKKVLANIQVYRSRLGSPDKALKLKQDLNRGRKEEQELPKPVLATN